jgi:fumarate hydratase subunit beta
MAAHGALYFCAIGGAGALAARCVVGCEEVAFRDLGCESVKRLELRDFPLVLAIDAQGGNLFLRQP